MRYCLSQKQEGSLVFHMVSWKKEKDLGIGKRANCRKGFVYDVSVYSVCIKYMGLWSCVSHGGGKLVLLLVFWWEHALKMCIVLARYFDGDVVDGDEMISHAKKDFSQ